MLVLLGALFVSCDQSSNEVSQQDNSYTVVYDKNADDVTGTMADSVFTIGSPQNLQPNAFTRALPAGSPFAYAFAGWALSADGSPEYADGDVFDFSASAGSTVTLYAIWKEYPIIVYPVPQDNITQVMNYHAELHIPTNNAGNPAFSHFAVFYRIYVSDSLQPSITKNDFSTINPVLASDYNSVYPYIDSETLTAANMDTLFKSMGYWRLALQNVNIDNVLSSSVLGSTLVFDFPATGSVATGILPTMTIGDDVYTLRRSGGNGVFTPHPDFNFLNTDDLRDPSYINVHDSADIADKSGIDPAARLYTYVAMFIVAVGVDTNTYSFIYSTPSLIHVFKLPDPQ